MGFRHLALFFLTLLMGGVVLAQKGDSFQDFVFEKGYIGIRDRLTDRILGVLYADHGNITKLYDVRFDILNKLHTEMPPNIQKVKLYPLGCDSPAIVKAFWKKYSHSQAILESPQATLRMQQRLITGDSELRLYSPDADLYGIGYEFHYGDHRLDIMSDVKIVLRQKEGGDGPLSIDFMPPANDMISDSKHTANSPKGPTR